MALPLCYETPRLDGPPVEVPSLGSEFEGEGSPIVVPDLPVDLDPTLIESRKECYPSSKEALRGALDGGIAPAAAGVTWSGTSDEGAGRSTSVRPSEAEERTRLLS